MVPPCSDRISRVPPYSRTKKKLYPYGAITHYGSPFQTISVPRSLVTTNGVSVDVLSSGYLDISVYRVCFAILCIQIEMTLRPGFPIRISADQSLLAAPHGFSQRVTSFIASWHQGIHQMPFLTLDQLTHGKTSDVVLTFIHVKDALICSRELLFN